MIVLPAIVREHIREDGRAAYPEECCGALLGAVEEGTARIARAQSLENSREQERRRRFRIGPEEYRRAERVADAEGLTLLGFYHSHPDHPAVPSDYDREHAFPFFHYVIVNVSSGGPGEMASWVLSEDRRIFDREPILPVGTEE